MKITPGPTFILYSLTEGYQYQEVALAANSMSVVLQLKSSEKLKNE